VKNVTPRSHIPQQGFPLVMKPLLLTMVVLTKHLALDYPGAVGTSLQNFSSIISDSPTRHLDCLFLAVADINPPHASRSLLDDMILG
jgi:hypothetical protein